MVNQLLIRPRGTTQEGEANEILAGNMLQDCRRHTLEQRHPSFEFQSRGFFYVPNELHLVAEYKHHLISWHGCNKYFVPSRVPEVSTMTVGTCSGVTSGGMKTSERTGGT